MTNTKNSQPIYSQLDGHILTLVINRADKMNALTDAMYATLTQQLKQAEQDDHAKVIIIQSSSEHFCAGNDIADFMQIDFSLQSHVVQFMLTIAQLSKPVIAVVSGAAIGIGATMLLHCDLVYAAANSKFSMPFIKLGLTPEAASSRLVAQKCGLAKAQEWLLTGRTFLSQEALESGLINQSFATLDEAKTAAVQNAQSIARHSLALLTTTKKLLKAEQTLEILALIKQEAEVFAQRLKTDEAKQALQAFLNR